MLKVIQQLDYFGEVVRTVLDELTRKLSLAPRLSPILRSLGIGRVSSRLFIAHMMHMGERKQMVGGFCGREPLCITRGSSAVSSQWPPLSS